MTRRRLNTAEAAEALGISVDAVRMRVRRESLEAERDANGRLYVWLDTDEAQSDTGALISAKDETIAALREQLEQANERDRENRRIIAALTSRIPELEAPSDERDAPETVEEEAPRGNIPPDPKRPGERPWWRRIFGG